MLADIDPDACYRACAGREARFDGRFFLAVTTTGIYCRPSCPARMPKPENCRFLPTAAAAVAAGFRACRRCRPDALPGTRLWDESGDLAGRAVALIRDGIVDEVGVAGLAARLGVSSRHLHRLLASHVGAGAAQLNQTRRAQVARALIDDSAMPLADVAFAAGFGSVRQFNDVMRAEFGCPPSRLRGPRGRERADGMVGGLSLRLPVRPPVAWGPLRAALDAHAIEGLERAERDAHTRVIETAAGPVLATIAWPDDSRQGHVGVRLSLNDVAGTLPAITAIRRWLDLDADPLVIDGALSSDPALAPLVERRPGLRVPGAVDGNETALFTVLGQQISLAAARTVQARLVATFGAASPIGDGWRSTPVPGTLATAGPDAIRTALRLTRAKATSLHALAEALANGLHLSPGADLIATRRALLALPGIGPWTTEFIAMRALRDPDALPANDLVLARALGSRTAGETSRTAEAWRPWRAYATMHHWTEETYS